MAEWFASGRVLHVLLLFMAAEGVLLVAYHRRTGRGVPPRAVLLNLLSGMCLLLAMRIWLGGAWWGWISMCLLAAGALHAADLWRLWRRA